MEIPNGSGCDWLSTTKYKARDFNEQTMRSHEQAIIRIAQYLRSTKERGVIFQPDPKLGLEFFVDAYFVGCWSQADADDPYNVMSCTGYIIRYACFIIGWCSKLQT